MFKFKIEQKTLFGINDPSRIYQFAYVKWKENKPTWEQRGVNIWYIAPFGYIVRIIHRRYVKYRIFLAWRNLWRKCDNKEK